MVGNMPNYRPLDVLRCLIRLERSTGRKSLSEDLDLGEGTVKALLGILKKRGIISSTKEGHALDKNGRRLLVDMRKLLTLPEHVSYTDFYSELNNSAVQLKEGFKLHEKTRETIDVVNVRDVAVRIGADAAFVLFYRRGRLKMAETDTYVFTQIQRQFKLKEGDVVLVSFAKTRRLAELGVFAQAVLSNFFFARLISKKLGIRLDYSPYYK
ncbi:hypothetical protein HYY73_02245 [Candidatus Woesearchaeota archaeon]|nr:hypothetical protein [Candidatus Woesearchaeota archaeon]